MHSTSLLGLLKEFLGQNLQNFVSSASAYVFGQRPNFLKWELQLQPNVKNTASVIHCTAALPSFKYQFVVVFLFCQTSAIFWIILSLVQAGFLDSLLLSLCNQLLSNKYHFVIVDFVVSNGHYNSQLYSMSC